MKKLLSPNGNILIEIPNANDALLTLYKCEGFQRFHWSYHLFLYTAETVTKLFHRVDASIQYIKHIQRYSLANHLYWLAKQKPGGHKEWGFLDSPSLTQEYSKQLASREITDTLMASICFPENNK